MGLVEKFLPKEDRYAALMLYGMVVAMCFNGTIIEWSQRSRSSIVDIGQGTMPVS